MRDNEIIQEATEAVEKNLNAGCYVEELLRIIKEQKSEIEKLREQIKKGDKIYEEAMLNAEAEKDNLKQVVETLKNDRIVIELDDKVLLKDFKTEVKKEINTIKLEAYREFCEKAIQTVTEFFYYQPHLDTKEDVLAHTFRILKELTKSEQEGERGKEIHTERLENGRSEEVRT